MEEEMIDSQNNTVYVSEFLRLRFPVIYEVLKTNLTAHGLKLKHIIGTSNIWARDYMPFQVHDQFVKFKYKSYGYDDFPWLRVLDKSMSFCNPTHTDIVLDGGNCVRCKSRAIITEKVFEDNKDTQSGILSKLESLLDCEVLIIPSEPDDSLGHADGMLKFIDEKTIFLNDYSNMMKIAANGYKRYMEDVIDRLDKAGLTVELFPLAYHKCPKITVKKFKEEYPYSDAFLPAFGYLINFLRVRELVFLPVFGVSEDKEAVDKCRKLMPNCDVVAIDCRELSMEGGCLNCVTWSIKE
jgi:agmatine deiminase